MRSGPMITGLLVASWTALPAAAQQNATFLCAPGIVGGARTQSVGNVDVSTCSDVIGLSLGVQSAGGDVRRAGRTECEPIEVLKPIDRASPEYLRRAFEQSQLQRVDVRLFAPDPDTGETRQMLDVSLRQVAITGVGQEVAAGQAFERLTLAANQVIVTFPETGGAATLACQAGR